MKHVVIGLGLTLLTATGCVVDPTYTYCASTRECEADEICREVVLDPRDGPVGAFCTSECLRHSDCESNLGFPGACLEDYYGPICFQECDFDEDCFSTSVCDGVVDATGLLVFVCLPVTL